MNEFIEKNSQALMKIELRNKTAASVSQGTYAVRPAIWVEIGE